MNVDAIERVFGRARLKMATGDHVEVFREAAVSGERRRYTKRFLASGGDDFRKWTDREWRILARLIGHGVRGVPAVARYHGGAEGEPSELETYDAGVSVDQWATLLPVERDGARQRSVFDDCAHWWALAHHCLAALDEIHALELVHLDVKADNICIPFAPASYQPSDGGRLRVDFPRLALIDFAFSLVSRERLANALPLGWQKDYDYQSPRLLRALEAGRAGDLVPTQELDWRCDLYSLAAMLRRYLPDDAPRDDPSCGWTRRRQDDARALIYRLRECHDGEDLTRRPHRELLASTAAHMGDPGLAQSLADGWTLVRDAVFLEARSRATPMTRIAAPIARTSTTDVQRTVTPALPVAPTVFRNPRARAVLALPPTPVAIVPAPVGPRRRVPYRAAVAAVLAAVGILAVVRDADSPRLDAPRIDLAAPVRATAPAVPLASPARESAADGAPTERIARATMPKAVPAPPKAAPAPPAQRLPSRPKPPSSTSGERALALLQGADVPFTSSLPYDAEAARRATARLAQEATRVSPASTLPSLPQAAAIDVPPPLPMAKPQTEPVVVARADPAPLPAEVNAAAAAPPVVRAPESPKPTAKRADSWRDRIHSALGALGLNPEKRAAPVEERPIVRPSRPAPEPDHELAARGRRFVVDMVPVVAAQATLDAAVPLDLAGNRGLALASRAHADAANLTWRAETVYPISVLDVRRARELYEGSRSSHAAGRTAEAVELGLQAFAANARDPDVAGFLAFLHLRTQPLRPETARQLALHALAHGGAQRASRFEDWNTFAIASALTGRPGDASRAYQLMAALAHPDRSCRAAMRAQSQFGDALRVPVEALTQRLRREGRTDEAPGCSGALARMAAVPG